MTKLLVDLVQKMWYNNTMKGGFYRKRNTIYCVIPYYKRNIQYSHNRRKGKIMSELKIICPKCKNEYKFPTSDNYCPKCKTPFTFLISKNNKKKSK